MKTIAIIPARSGSKGLKDKNVKTLVGKPMMAYTIEAAIESNIFDTIMVSTDSEKYAKIAQKYGAEVPFLRSEKTASDSATTRECVLEVLDEYEKNGVYFDRLVVLQPTSPLRNAMHIIEANDLYISKNAQNVISVCEVDHSPLWCNSLPETLSLEGFVKTSNNTRRQELKQFYRLNGAIYIHDVNHYRKHSSCFDETAYAYIMEKEASFDIDDAFDFLMAETILQRREY